MPLRRKVPYAVVYLKSPEELTWWQEGDPVRIQLKKGRYENDFDVDMRRLPKKMVERVRDIISSQMEFDDLEVTNKLPFGVSEAEVKKTECFIIHHYRHRHRQRWLRGVGPTITLRRRLRA